MTRTASAGRKAAGIRPAEIGYRARVIRCHRGLSPDVVAGLAGISEDHLVGLESGARRFVRRGLIEDLAGALGCSVTDLTGQPYLPADRAGADALAVVPGIREALCDTTLDDPPDRPARPMAELARRTDQAQGYLDQERYALAGWELGTLLAELHLHGTSKDVDVRRAALAVLVPACHVAATIAATLGYHDLALVAGRRELDAATRLGDPVLLGLARFGWAWRWIDVGARRQAEAANGLALAELDEAADPSAADTGPAELLGTHLLLAATLAARAGRSDDADGHLDQARSLAARLGERNTAGLHFGPTTVTLCTLSVGVELGQGPQGCERAQPDQVDVGSLRSRSRSRTGGYHLDLARALAQYDGARDADAVRHLKRADRAAPVSVRNNPLARELTAELIQRAHRQRREVDRLAGRFGLGGRGSPSVNP